MWHGQNAQLLLGRHEVAGEYLDMMVGWKDLKTGLRSVLSGSWGMSYCLQGGVVKTWTEGKTSMVAPDCPEANPKTNMISMQLMADPKHTS